MLILYTDFAPLRAIFVSMNFTNEQIKSIASISAESFGFFLVDLVIRGDSRNRIIEVFIDSEKNISAEDCALVSRDINSKLNDIFENFRLDVSSPGTDRPLVYLKQFPKHLNRKFEILYTEDEQLKKISGKLIEINGEYLTFYSSNKSVMVNFNNIKQAKVIPTIS